jgi:hypothetical protein
MQRAGAFVYLDDDGFVTIERGPDPGRGEYSRTR